MRGTKIIKLDYSQEKKSMSDDKKKPTDDGPIQRGGNGEKNNPRPPN